VLAGFFPNELNIGATQMSTEDVARVLVYLVEKKLISVSGTAGLTSVKKVEPGWHFCQFYRNFNQLLDMIAPYIAEGLKNGEGCLWVLPEAVTPNDARNALAGLVDDIDAHFASGQLEMLSHPDWYLDTSRRLRSFEEISQALLARQDRALARGFKFLRAAGDTGWVSGTEQSKHFIDYEMKVNPALRDTKVAAVCTYRADVTADEFIAIVTAHQDALYQARAH
jgi:two-component system sensor kinase FixL